jgi:hypothetical protein
MSRGSVGVAGGILSVSLQTDQLDVGIQDRQSLPFVIFGSLNVVFLSLRHRDLAFDGEGDAVGARYSQRGSIAADCIGVSTQDPELHGSKPRPCDIPFRAWHVSVHPFALAHCSCSSPDSPDPSK